MESTPDASRVSLSSGLSLHVELTSPASAPVSTSVPVLFIHGLGGSSTNFGPVIEASRLSSTHQIITFDLEGHGLSPLGGNEASIVAYAESARGVLDACGVEKAIVVGHSMGGLIATTLAATYPARVDKLILIGPIKQFGEAGIKALTARADAVRKDGMIVVADTVSKAGVSQRTLATNPLARHFARASLLSTSAEGYALACLAITKAQDPDYAKIEAPTRILAGEEDKTSPEATVTFLEQHIPDVRVSKMQHVGHWHLSEDIQGVAKAIKEFVA